MNITQRMRQLFAMSKQSLILEIIDLECHRNVLSETEAKDSIEIEEIADDDGNLRDIVHESIWIASVRDKTGIDIRAIRSPLPRALGFYRFQCLTKELELIEVKVWVVSPTKDESC